MKTTTQQLSPAERIWRAVRLLFRAMRPRRNKLTLPEIHQTAQGFEYHLYYPSGKPIRTVVLIYGMTIEGENDTRLIKFARACASAGLRVVVPHLPGLRDFRIAPEDLERLQAILTPLALDSPEKIGLIGFSTGGSYALLLAALPALQDKIGPILLFSPIYAAREVFESLHTQPVPAPKNPKEWDQFYWGQFVIAFRNRKPMELPEEVSEALAILLADWEAYELEVKRLFHKNHLAQLDLAGRPNLLNEGAALDQLSARGHLQPVKSPVLILHDSSDLVVSPEHSRQMYLELTQRGPEFRQEALITPWLAHIALQKTGNLSELVKIVSFIAELFR